MKFALIMLACCLSVLFTFAQDTISLKHESQKSKVYTDRPPQAIYAELGGNGILLSVNYDRRFNKRTTGLGFRAGLGYSFDSYTPFVTVPVAINYLMGKRNSFFEVGVGETAVFIGNVKDYGGISIGDEDFTSKEVLLITALNIGYRLQPVKGGFNLRAGFMPLFVKSSTSILPYVSLGYNF